MRSPLIATGEVEERQVDPTTGRALRCDIRLNAPNGRKLASGEMKRPEAPEGRDVTNDALVADARRKALSPRWESSATRHRQNQRRGGNSGRPLRRPMSLSTLRSVADL